MQICFMKLNFRIDYLDAKLPMIAQEWALWLFQYVSAAR